MSRDGSSKVPLLLASCARRSSFCDVAWIPRPILADIRANSLVAPVDDEASAPSIPDDERPPSPPPMDDAPEDLAARSAAAANSFVRSRTDAVAMVAKDSSSRAADVPVAEAGRR